MLTVADAAFLNFATGGCPAWHSRSRGKRGKLGGDEAAERPKNRPHAERGNEERAMSMPNFNTLPDDPPHYGVTMRDDGDDEKQPKLFGFA
jgi:hypothetical protein